MREQRVLSSSEDSRKSRISDDANAGAERALLARVTRDDRAALTELFDRTASPIYAVLLRWVPSPQDADSILRTVFMQLWDDRHSLSSSSDRPLLRLIETARRLALEKNFIRASPRDDRPGSAWPTGHRPEDAYSSGVAPPPQKLLQAIYFDGATVPQLASRYGLSPQALRETLVTAMSALRRELKPEK